MNQHRRYAVYAVPPAGDPLAEVAAAWLGRDPYRDRAVPFDPVVGLSPGDHAELVAPAARYGFHGTLMAPFSLVAGMNEGALEAAVTELAAKLPGAIISDLRLIRIGAFFALGPAMKVSALHRLADDIVASCQPFRAPLDQAELVRRRKAGLTAEEDAYLVAWGYPYVFGAFRYHMTLTGPVPDRDADRVEAILRHRFAPFIGQPFTVDTIALFVEPAPGAPFRVHSTASLAGARVVAPG